MVTWTVFKGAKKAMKSKLLCRYLLRLPALCQGGCHPFLPPRVQGDCLHIEENGWISLPVRLPMQFSTMLFFHLICVVDVFLYSFFLSYRIFRRHIVYFMLPLYFRNIHNVFHMFLMFTFFNNILYYRWHYNGQLST